MIRRRTITALTVLVLALLGSSCGARVQELTWEAPTFPLRSDLGDLAPAEGRYQRLMDDVLMTLETDDGAEYTIEAELFWIVLNTSSEAEDPPLSWFEFKRLTGREDADMIPALSELATAVGWEFDEAAATDWVTSNDEGFRLHVRGQSAADYGIVLEAEDDLNNSVSVFFYFPTEGETIEASSATNGPPRFDGRPIGG